jgi:uncharacterized protein with PQ loop repeat
MTSAEIALVVFAICNSVRVFAYVPQIIAVARDQRGASAISYTTWGLFAVSHLSTVAYAFLVVDDWRMAAVFVVNALCCVAIVSLTAWKRALFKTAQRLIASAQVQTIEDHALDGRVERSPELAAPLHGGQPHFLVVAGGKNIAVQPR